MIKAHDQVTVVDITDPISVVTYYLLQASTLAAPSVPTVAEPSGWSTTEPAFSSGATNTLYTCVKTTWGDGTFKWGTVNVSSSYEAAKAAYNAAQAAADTLQTYIREDSSGIVVGKVEGTSRAHVNSDGAFQIEDADGDVMTSQDITGFTVNSEVGERLVSPYDTVYDTTKITGKSIDMMGGSIESYNATVYGLLGGETYIQISGGGIGHAFIKAIGGDSPTTGKALIAAPVLGLASVNGNTIGNITTFDIGDVIDSLTRVKSNKLFPAGTYTIHTVLTGAFWGDGKRFYATFPFLFANNYTFSDVSISGITIVCNGTAKTTAPSSITVSYKTILGAILDIRWSASQGLALHAGVIECDLTFTIN